MTDWTGGVRVSFEQRCNSAIVVLPHAIRIVQSLNATDSQVDDDDVGGVLYTGVLVMLSSSERNADYAWNLGI